MMMNRSAKQLGISLFLVSLLLGAEKVLAAEPLLMDGKQTLYQRMLAKPGAEVSSEPAAADSQAVTPFTAFYVYERRGVSGDDWIRVGTDAHGQISGWIRGRDLIPWNQSLTVSFRKPLNHDRVMLFKDKASLKQLVESNSLARYDALYKTAAAGQPVEDDSVVAIQPTEFVDILKEFYLVPILDHEDIYLGSERATMLKVMTVPLSDEVAPVAAQPVKSKESANSAPEFKTGVVFVVDSTMSMGPYIERTRQAVKKAVEQLQTLNHASALSYGLIAFRDAPEVAEGLSYRVKTFSQLDPRGDVDRFLEDVRDVGAATVSSEGFIEDSYAGIYQAITELNWDGFDARYVILITDAGAREKDDPLSSTHMNANELKALAAKKEIALSVLHLLTPQGAKNHALAKAQYETLSDFPDIGSLYFSVDGGDVGGFGAAIDALTLQLSRQIDIIAGSSDKQPGQVPVAAPELRKFQARIEKLGHALRMKYLTKQQGDAAPAFFDAWVIDRDFRKPELRTLDVRVLLTRDQLSDLHDVVAQVLKTFEDGLISPSSFFESLKKLAATISRDPTKLTDSGMATLNDLGFMREYIEDLPYRSEAMELTVDDWVEWPPRRQIEYIHRLEEKLRYYKALYEHTDLWVSLDGGPVSGSSLFPVELEMLP